MANITKTNRRDFLKIAATATGGLFIGFYWSGCDSPKMQVLSTEEILSKATDFNSFLSITPDGDIVIYSPNPELGQNIKTSFPMVVAEELDADWSRVRVLQANLDTEKYERQLTGGSGAMPHSWERLRKAGATARLLLISAAATRLEVDKNTLTTEKGIIYHKESGRKLSYGEVVLDAAQLEAPDEVIFKDPKDFKIIGTPVKNVDNKDIFTGKPLFGLDFYREGMLLAMVQRPPFGMKIKSVDDASARAIPGIQDVIVYDNNVAIVGNSTWPLMKAKRRLNVSYEPEGEVESSFDHDRIFKELLDSKDARAMREDGDVDAAFKNASKIVTSEYQCPFLSHSPMEPMNFFAHVKEDQVELIGPTQTPDSARVQTANLLGIPKENISVEITRLGGGFGRRLRADYVLEAVEISKRMNAPVKVTWSREDDMTGGAYRPAVRYRFSAALDEAGNMIGYKLRGVGMNAGNSVRQDNFPSGAVENVLIENVNYASSITTNAWRAPITNFLAYAEQSFLDEVALEAQKDPIQFRLELLEKAKTSPIGSVNYDIDRMIGVIKDAAEKSNWGKDSNVKQGFSVYFSHRSYVAQVANIEMENNQPVLKKIIASTDCGIVVNPTGANHQVRGGIVDGMGHAMYGNLTFENGLPKQKNFDSYRLIRMKEVPEVEVHYLDSGFDPTGLGEPALPPTGGAIANAIFAATGRRLRSQPFVEQKEFSDINLEIKRG
ncbi:aerobic-type carbon monoxide dehydrogenase, large subunit CoxL/CutL-like protein [Belliella baltica DSM 15883]|uniref:Aerobic-type carbon monoxide dehydrogenase, large subunit CoxL/CutL-like protein n=1 Tax=Belliella baltica (strain DSM 15883 / CIP 108006 / LMG 21964 / BA134) TaxID=866536 RepID=I3Z872_BELBD|nr:molybdopterin cofactor-binding domain-containing protein [Belliella baltica]AFL85440.1 aerobic-type carbon monoxide dehydrogenase, large subunit CoxL/CutL-like protein [Belliella baltica DSM 15883]